MVSIVRDKVSVTPVSTERSTSPALCFTLELSLDRYPYEMLLRAEGFLLSEDGKILANLSVSRLLLEAGERWTKEIYSIKAGDPARFKTEPKAEKISLVAWLDRRVLDEINTLRQKRGGDVFFKLLLDVLILDFNIVLHHTDLSHPKNTGYVAYVQKRKRLWFQDPSKMVSIPTRKIYGYYQVTAVPCS